VVPGAIFKITPGVVGALSIWGSHIGVADFGALLIAIAWVVSLLRDYRPARALREELKDERAARGDLERKYDELEKRHAELERKYETLSKGRDFGLAFAPLERAIDQARADASHEHEKILVALEGIVKALSQNSAVVGALAAGINAGTIPN
jgi:cell division protein FtsB